MLGESSDAALRCVVSSKLLILDLDETLVYATEQSVPGASVDLYVGPYLGYERPRLREFLHCGERADCREARLAESICGRAVPCGPPAYPLTS